MYIMPSSCFSDSSKTAANDLHQIKDDSLDTRSIDKLIADNPLIFRICCCCFVRRRKRVDTAKQNGITSHAINDSNSDENILNIDQIEFTQTSPIANENGKMNGNELAVQQFTGLAESDDARSEKEVIKTEPTSAKSRTSDTISNIEIVEDSVEHETRHSSGQTENHNVNNSDNENNLNSIDSSPLHLAQDPTSNEIIHVSDEIAESQPVIESVKEEDDQKPNSPTASPTVEQPSTPLSINSNKTLVYDEKVNEDEVDIVQTEVQPSKSSPSSDLETESPLHRIATPKVEDVPNNEDVIEEDSFISNDDPILEDQTIDELNEEEMVVIDNGIDEVDELLQQHETTIDTSPLIDEIVEDDNITIDADESVESQQVSSPPPEEAEVPVKVNEKMLSNVKRQAPLKRIHKVTPVKNSMPNIHQSSTVPVKKVNSTIFPPTLKKFERPKEAVHLCLAQLDSSNWEVVMEGLKTFVRLIRHHPKNVDNHIHLMTMAISKQVKNLRSQVSRSSCSVASELFVTNAESLDADAEELSAALLNRTADTNKFLRADALKALESMCESLHPSKVIFILTFRGAAHQNAAVRCTTARLFNFLVSRIGCDKVINMPKEIRDRFILTGANLLMEGSLETRSYTKELFKQLSTHSHYQKLLQEIIPSNIYRNIEKSLKSIQ